MTASLTKTNPTSTFYHSEIGIVNFIRRHSAKLSFVLDGVPKSIDLGTGRYTSDVMFWKGDRCDFFVIELGCGALLKFPWSAVEYLEAGRHCVLLEKTELIDELPRNIEFDELDY